MRRQNVYIRQHMEEGIKSKEIKEFLLTKVIHETKFVVHRAILYHLWSNPREFLIHASYYALVFFNTYFVIVIYYYLLFII